jgi:hypothetical protein
MSSKASPSIFRRDFPFRWLSQTVCRLRIGRDCVKTDYWFNAAPIAKLGNSARSGSVEAHGRIFSWERVWHPSHAALKQHGPYLAVLVELPHAGGVRMVGNLLGDPFHSIAIGAEVEGVFEHHLQADPQYSLLQWRLASHATL